MHRTVRIAALVGFAALSMACGKKEGGGGGTSVTSAAITPEAKELFQSRCAACHGPNGDGTGPGAAALNPKPRNYHDKNWQKTVTDDQIRQTILKGGAAVGKSPMMPGNPDLESKPETVTGLVAIVRQFGQQ